MHDNNTETTIVSFFSGYGGLEMGISAALGGNTSVLAYVERDAFPVANMVAKMEQGLMDAAPVFTDVTRFPYRAFRGLVDIACGGVPCQPHSHAGKRKGGSDERFLFDDFCDGMAEMRPGIILIENVQGLLTSKMPDGTLCIRHVLNKLESIGYCVESHTGKPLIGIFSASEVGAPHQRKRVFILAYDMRRAKPEFSWGGEPGRKCAPESRDSLRAGTSGGDSGRSEAEGNKGESASVLPEDVAHHHHQGLQGVRERGGQTGWEVEDGYLGGDSQVWPSRPGERQYAWEPPRVVGQSSNEGQSFRGCGEVGGQGEPQPELKRPDSQQDDAEREIKSEVGRVLDRPADGLDFPRGTGLSDSELEEIYGWMVKGTNRTDELRLCGNGVVSQTAEKAWRVLYEELCSGKSGNHQIQGNESEREKETDESRYNGSLFGPGVIDGRICPPQERNQNGQQNRESGDNRPGESRAGTPSSLSSAESLRVVRGSIHAAQDKAQEGEGVLPGVQQQSAGEVGVENQEKEIDKPSGFSLPNCSGDLPGQMSLFEEIK